MPRHSLPVLITLWRRRGAPAGAGPGRRDRAGGIGPADRAGGNWLRGGSMGSDLQCFGWRNTLAPGSWSKPNGSPRVTSTRAWRLSRLRADRRVSSSGVTTVWLPICGQEDGTILVIRTRGAARSSTHISAAILLVVGSSSGSPPRIINSSTSNTHSCPRQSGSCPTTRSQRYPRMACGWCRANTSVPAASLTGVRPGQVLRCGLRALALVESNSGQPPARWRQFVAELACFFWKKSRHRLRVAAE